MEIRNVDVAVIGSGSAGLNARREVEKAGGQPLLIESGPYGTTCARVGCMPSKLLIAAADVAHEIGAAERFGIRVPQGVRVDGRAVLERVRRERDRFVDFVVRDTVALPEAQRLRGYARFVGPSTLEVDPLHPGEEATRVEARAVVVAAGSEPWVPPPFDAIREHVMVNDDVFELQDLPESLAVVGTGVVGLELGQALARLGVRVVFFNRSASLGPFSDPEVKRVVRETLDAELELELEVGMLEARVEAAGVALRWRTAAGAEREKRFERVLLASGRRPSLGGLDLAKAGVELDARGRPASNPSTGQIGKSPVFLAGDVSGYQPLLHEAADEGRIAGANAAHFPNVTSHERRARLEIAFTDPQMAIVGTPYRELDLGDIEIGEVSYADQGRARVAGVNRGLVRLYAARRGCSLIGAEMFGPRVEHMAHGIAWAVQQGMTVQQILRMPIYHPVFEEGLRTALRELAGKLRVTGDCPCEDFAERPAA